MNTELNIENINFQLAHLALPIVVLIGPPGVGKTAVGQLLAQDLNWQFWDTDAIIENATSMKITDIFSQRGESVFRALEKALVKDILALYEKPSNTKHRGGHGTVLSCGGGLPVPADNFAKLSQLGKIVALHAPVNLLIERIGNKEHRPLLDTKLSNSELEQISNRQAKLDSLIHERKAVYGQANYIVDTSDQTINAVAQSIKTQLEL